MAFDANQIGGIKGSQFFSVSANSEKAESSSNENSNSIFENFSSEAQKLGERAKRENDGSIADWFFENGFLNADFDEISKIGSGNYDGVKVVVNDNGQGRYIEIDFDGDGKYDQKAKYDADGKKINEEIDSNGDGKLDTVIGYDSNGNAKYIMADENYDGWLDFSESAKED